MKVLGLDISSKCGWALMEGDSIENRKLLEYGLIQAPNTLDHSLGQDPYPWGFCAFCTEQADRIVAKAVELKPDVIVVEETNLGKNRYAQKILEWLHLSFLGSLAKIDPERSMKVVYTSSSRWRQSLGLVMSKQDKKNNAKLSKAKRNAALHGQKLDKAAIGVKGKVTKKHIAIRYVNDPQKFGLSLKVKDNDMADAICLAEAFFCGTMPCDGKLD